MVDEADQRPEPAGVEYTPEEREVLSFLAASKRVDLRWLSEEQEDEDQEGARRAAQREEGLTAADLERGGEVVLRNLGAVPIS